MMTNPVSNLTSSGDGDNLVGKFVSGRMFFLQGLRILVHSLALLVLFAIHSLRQKQRYGLPVWPFLGMLPSLVFGVRLNLYEWITDEPRASSQDQVLCLPKGPYYRDNMCDLLGEGIFNADNETWQLQRKTASIEFHSAKFRQLTTESLLELVHSRLLPILENVKNKSISIDLQDILLRLAFDHVCMIAFGVDPGCLSPGLPHVPFAKASEDGNTAPFCYAEMVMENHEGKNPRVEQKIIAEICRIINEREDMKNGGESKRWLIFKPGDIKKMGYLHAALSEALRLYPSVPVDHSEAAEDNIFPDGTVLKKGMNVYSLCNLRDGENGRAMGKRLQGI
ncbi:hypothetical protein V6N11_081322 [Hibiscus sabdariffa]|uniref:Cytochrome P450 n=1 Tax=Hibiscus sabdariffa TaxID=183260 RepID=A0ABR2QJI1_9ROSI